MLLVYLGADNGYPKSTLEPLDRRIDHISSSAAEVRVDPIRTAFILC